MMGIKVLTSYIKSRRSNRINGIYLLVRRVVSEAIAYHNQDGKEIKLQRLGLARSRLLLYSSPYRPQYPGLFTHTNQPAFAPGSPWRVARRARFHSQLRKHQYNSTLYYDSGAIF